LRADGKLRCLFKPQDTIFQLQEETDLMPSEQEKQTFAKTSVESGVPLMCNTCCATVQSIKKLKFCQFCAQANCGLCLNKTRPYPKNNNDKARRGQICLQCDKKFLYRDALHENKIKLEIRDSQNEE
jgi:hypothetical protein